MGRPSRIISASSRGSIRTRPVPAHLHDGAHPRQQGTRSTGEPTFAAALRAVILSLLRGYVGNLHYRRMQSLVCFGKEKSKARPDQLITFTRCLREMSIKYCDLPSAAFDQTCTFELSGGIRDGRPLDTQHFGKQALSDKERASPSLRSRIMSSQRANRCLRLCAPLHATDTMTCSRKAWM
jgi:hypothetical protein